MVVNNLPLRVEELYEPECESDSSQRNISPLSDGFHFQVCFKVESLLQRGREQRYKVGRTVVLIVRLLTPQLEQLRGSRFDTPEDLTAFAQKFDEGVKRAFSNDQVPQYVKFGALRDHDPELGIKAGRLTLTG